MAGGACSMDLVWNKITFRLSPILFFFFFRKISWFFLSRETVELIKYFENNKHIFWISVKRAFFWSSRGWVSSILVLKCHVWNCHEDWDMSVGFDSYCLLSFSSSLRSSFISSESWCWSATLLQKQKNIIKFSLDPFNQFIQLSRKETICMI